MVSSRSLASNDDLSAYEVLDLGMLSSSKAKVVEHSGGPFSYASQGLVAEPNCTVGGACTDIAGAAMLRIHGFRGGTSVDSVGRAGSSGCLAVDAPRIVAFVQLAR